MLLSALTFDLSPPSRYDGVMQPSNDKISEMLNSPEAKAKADNPDTLKQIQDGFEDAFSKVKDKLGDAWQDVQMIYQMSMDKSFDMKPEVKYASIGALAYLVSPIDILPERLLGAFGLADDIAVLHFALQYAKPEIERYRAFKSSATPATSTVTPPTNPQ
jgi:uncharacterized membrane protein YkvA (DUF1232 family)